MHGPQTIFSTDHMRYKECKKNTLDDQIRMEEAERIIDAC